LRVGSASGTSEKYNSNQGGILEEIGDILAVNGIKVNIFAGIRDVVPAHPSSRSRPGSHSVLTRSIEHRTKFDFYFLYSLIFPLSIFLPSLFFLLRGRKIRKTENLSFLSLLDTGRKKGEL